jgi:hypothetical protein
MIADPRLAKVLGELRRYEHPLVAFDARLEAEEVCLVLRLKISGIYEPEYTVRLTDREIAASNFPWNFQRLLYNCLHDYLVEMFVKTPHTR